MAGNMDESRCVLAVYAHPDDAEIWAGGTLLAHREAGDRTALCILTHGNSDRAAECRAGAAALDAALHQFAYPDRALTVNDDTIEAVAAVMRAERPQLILTHWEGDSHPDHLAVWQITRAAVLRAEIENEVRAVYWSDTYNGLGNPGLFQADCLIDVTPHWSAKLAAIDVHRSQNPDHYVALCRRQCAAHGARAGVAFAEGFRRAPLFGRGQRAADTLWHFS